MSSADQPLDTLAVHSEQLTAHTLQLTSLNAKVNHIDAKVDLVLERLGPPKGPD